MVGSGKNEQVCHLKGGECLPQPILAMRYRKPRTTRILVFKDTGTLHFYWLSLYPQILTTNSNLNTVSDEQKNVVHGLPIGDPLLSVIPRLSFWKPRGQVLSVSAQVPVIARKQEHGSDKPEQHTRVAALSPWGSGRTFPGWARDEAGCQNTP